MPLPEARAGPKPKPRPKKREQAEQPRRKPLPDGAHAAERACRSPPMPEGRQEHFEEKHGYANYYFNTLDQRPGLEGVDRAGADFDGARGRWTHCRQVCGERRRVPLPTDRRRRPAEAARSANVKWTRRRAVGRVAAAGRQRRTAAGPVPVAAAGRRGAEPLRRGAITTARRRWPGHDGLVDVLVGAHQGVECRFYFDPAEGRLLALEMFRRRARRPVRDLFLRLS